MLQRCCQNHVTHHLFTYFGEVPNPVAISIFIQVSHLRRFVHRKTLYFFYFEAMFSMDFADFLFNARAAYFVTLVAGTFPFSLISRFHYLNRSIRLTLDHFQKKR